VKNKEGRTGENQRLTGNLCGFKYKGRTIFTKDVEILGNILILCIANGASKSL
jgi:hypothetical protein